jgi:hypothetical protein
MTKITDSRNNSHINAQALKDSSATQPITPQKTEAFELKTTSKDMFSMEISNVSRTEKAAPLFQLSNRPPMSEIEQRYVHEAMQKGPPEIVDSPSIKSPTHTFNHTHEYLIKDGFLWFRRLGEKNFQPLYFDGFPHQAPILVDSDGANLIVIDNHHQLHYKKVLEEFRREEVDSIHQSEIEKMGFSLDDCPYAAFDVSDINNWQHVWFSLPVASTVVNIFANHRFTLPAHSRAVAISQRGRYNDYVEDKLGQHHPVGTGVTTMYVLDNNGQDIHKFDPWSPPWAKTSIGLKETENSSFVANNISVSASTIMAVGYEIDFTTKKLTLKVLTMLADIDTIGSNPGIDYSFSDVPEKKDARILPIDVDWKEHPLSLEPPAMVTKNITIRQTGEGNNARQLRIQGTNKHGEWGYFQKMISDTTWSFIPGSKPRFPSNEVKPLMPLATQSSVHDYEGSYRGYPIKLRDFGQRSNHATITITINGQDHSVDLYRRWAFSTFFGFESYRYDLVINGDDHTLKEIFGEHKSMEVVVKEHKDKIVVRSHIISPHPFKLTFKGL